MRNFSKKERLLNRLMFFVSATCFAFGWALGDSMVLLVNGAAGLLVCFNQPF